LSNDAQTPRPDRNEIAPLEGEAGIPSVTQSRPNELSGKGIFAVVLFVLSIVAIGAMWTSRALSSSPKDADARRLADRPTAAAAEPRRLDLSLPPLAKAPAPPPSIPAIEPIPEDRLADPIAVRRTGQSGAGNTSKAAPEDAPVLLVSSKPQGATADAAARTSSRVSQDTAVAAGEPLDSTRRNLDVYQRQLQGLLDSLTKTTELATGAGTSRSAAAWGNPPATAPAWPTTTPTSAQSTAPQSLFGGQLQGSSTPRVTAGLLGNRSLTLPKGTAFTCALTTRVVSAASGFVGCQVQRNVYGDDGRVLLIERGSHLDGEYRIASVRPGTVRIPVLWTRIRTPLGVTVDINSPGTGPLGEAGIDGYVDNRWGERIGAAMLLSLIDDSVKLLIQNQSSDTGGDTIVLPSTTSGTSKLAEKVLDSTINIPPLIYQNQGAIVGIYVARDVDFTSVYELKAVGR
jgi:type IV secretion system protein VirB10